MRLQSFPILIIIIIIIIVVPFLCLTVAGCGDNDSPTSATPWSADAGAADAPPPPASSCGDALVQAAETCDDGNILEGDGCSENCVVEHGYSCVSQPSACTSTCGDGLVASDEACDDDNVDSSDGCADCAVTAGYSCYGEPSICESGAFATVSDVGLVIDDNHYDGSLESMSCVPLDISGFGGSQVEAELYLELYLHHTYFGDLTIKIVSPSGTVATVLQRPAGDRANPLGDDGASCCGDESDTNPMNKLVFVQSAATDAEAVGSGLGDTESVCSQVSCTFASNADQAGDDGLAGLVDEAVDGQWRVCFGNSEAYDLGAVHSLRLQLTQ